MRRLIQNSLITQNTTKFSTFKSASELWASAAPPHPNKRARGKRTTVKRLVDFQQGHNVGEVEGLLIKGLHDVPTHIQGRSMNKNKSTMEHSTTAMTMQMTQEELDAKAALKADRDAERLQKMNEEKIKDMETAFEYQGKSSRSWEYVRIPSMEPIDATGVSFQDFQCRILHVDRISHMMPTTGRVYEVRIILAMGNGKGSFATGSGIGENMGEAIRNAQNYARARIEKFDLYNGNTIFHDVTASHMRQTVQITRQPEGFGVRSNILFRYLCELVGLKDVYIKNPHKCKRPSSKFNKIKAFQLALRSLENPQQLADRTGFHVVEMDELDWDKPRIVAEPSGFEQGDDDHILPFDEYTAYFMHEQNKDAMKEEQMQTKAKEFQDSWATPNWSKFGYGWRGRVLNEDRKEISLESMYVRKINHPAMFQPGYRYKMRNLSYVSDNMKGGPKTSGEPYWSVPDIPSELEGLTELSIDN